MASHCKHSFNVYFRDPVKKEVFMRRLGTIHECLPLPGKLMSYHDMMLAMFDVVEQAASAQLTAVPVHVTQQWLGF